MSNVATFAYPRTSKRAIRRIQWNCWRKLRRPFLLERVKVSYDAFVVGAAHMKVDLFLYNIDSTILGAHTVSVCPGERGGSDQTNEEEEKTKWFYHFQIFCSGIGGRCSNIELWAKVKSAYLLVPVREEDDRMFARYLSCAFLAKLISFSTI